MLLRGGFSRMAVMYLHRGVALSFCTWLLTPVAALALSPPTMSQKAVVTNEQRLYREARVESKTVGRIAVGEEATVTGREGALLQLALPGDRIGWTLANGVVVLDNNPRAAALLFEAADALSGQDSLDAWKASARLFRKAASLAPSGPYGPEASWRAAELAWRSEQQSTGAVSGAVKELATVVSSYPKTRTAARAAFLLLRSSLCEYLDGTPGCPEVEIGLISRYLEQYPDSEQAAELRYAIAYRHAALVEIYLQQTAPHFNAEKAVEHKARAREAVEALLRQQAPGATTWAARGERLLWSLENNVGVYSGIEVALKKF